MIVGLANLWLAYTCALNRVLTLISIISTLFTLIAGPPAHTQYTHPVPSLGEDHFFNLLVYTRLALGMLASKCKLP
ncbi:hypothetical protein F4775DRAFT_568905 [Biscogniauxia sp. FL1348]|nr:hypothetical protein F4775DRAFT_568905 [Biscogniauxia sp. FL1348]